MAWVSLDELIEKTGAARFGFSEDPFAGIVPYVVGSDGTNRTLKGSNNEIMALTHLLERASDEILPSFGLVPTKTAQSEIGQTKSFFDLSEIQSAIKSKNVDLGYDPSQSKGNYNSSKGFSLKLGLLDQNTKQPLYEFEVGGESLGKEFAKGLAAIAPIASLGLGLPAQIGGAIASGAPAAVQSAIGGAVVSGATTALAGGDAEDVIKNALVGGAAGAVSELAKPYVQDAIDFVKDLSPEGLQDIVAAAGSAGDVAGNVADVDVGGAVSPTTTDIAMQAYDNAIAAGLSHQEAMNAAFAEVDAFTGVAGSGELSGFSPAANANALAGNVAGAGAAAGAATGASNALTSGTVVPVNAGGVSDTLSTGMQEELGLTGAYTGGNAAADAALGLGAAGTAAGVAGAGAAAGAAGAGGQMTAADLEGLDPNLTLGGGTDVLGGTDVTGGTGAIVTGAAGGAGAGAITAGGAAAAGLTGIPVVDDFLAYLGTPAGAAALGAFGSLASGYLTGQAAKDAAQIQANAAANALQLQREQFEYQKELLDPYRRRGESALNRLAGVMGLDGQPAQPQQLLDMDPGYAFRLGEGMKALERVQAARGNMLSGGAIKAGQRYAQDFASGEYGNAYNRLANIAGLGQTVGGQLGSAAEQFDKTAGETMSQGANALAAGRVGRTSGYMGGIGGAVGAYQNYQNQQQQNQLFRDIYGRMGV